MKIDIKIYKYLCAESSKTYTYSQRFPYLFKVHLKGLTQLLQRLRFTFSLLGIISYRVGKRNKMGVAEFLVSPAHVALPHKRGARAEERGARFTFSFTTTIFLRVHKGHNPLLPAHFTFVNHCTKTHRTILLIKSLIFRHAQTRDGKEITVANSVF